MAGSSGPGLGLRALLCCVFEKDEGPIVCCSDPPNAVGKQFKPLGRYMLPETFVRGRAVSIVLDDNVVLGAPVYIEDTLYSRNCFQFNICVVIGSNVDTEPHKDLAQHLATAFHALEVELWLLSDPNEVGRVQSILAQLRSQLNASEDCFVRVTGSRCIAFRVRRRRPALGPALGLERVPVPLVDLATLLAPASGAGRAKLPYEPDLALLQLVPFIDGIRSVQELVDASGLGEECAQTCLRHLLQFGLIAAIDAIELDNRYCLTPDFHVAFDRPEVRMEVVRYATAGQSWGDAESTEAVQCLYAEVDGWAQTLGEFQQVHAAELRERRVSLRHLVTFGLLRGFLERIDGSAQVLSQAELRELQDLRSRTIPRRKQELRGQGLDSQRVNKDSEIKAMVARMNELKAKQKRLPLGCAQSESEAAGEASEAQRPALRGPARAT